MGRRPTGKARARWMAYRVETLRKEGFTEREIVVLMYRRMSTLGIQYLRRERKRELRGLTDREVQEWRQQMAEVRDEAWIAEAIRDVSPD